ncbi:MAG: hypothetical protein O6945_11210 [Gammaproteobacteria bacterium]|nr:hypothetical protein [Gammaproteobacteria bacterium]
MSSLPDVILKAVEQALENQGLNLDALACGDDSDPEVKVVCVAPNLASSMSELRQAARDQVVMVRVDEQVSQELDSWVETDVVKSRSEAAALFIREGLEVRRSELDQLKETLEGVSKAKEELRKKAQQIFGDDKI